MERETEGEIKILTDRLRHCLRSSRYDTDMNKLEKVYQDEYEVYNEVVEQLRVYEGHYNQLRKEIEDANAREEEQKKAKEEEELQKKREAKAAATIQATWKMFQQQKSEAAGKGGKGKGKK